MSKRQIYFSIAFGSSLLTSRLLTTEEPVTWRLVAVGVIGALVAGWVALKALGSNPDTK